LSLLLLISGCAGKTVTKIEYVDQVIEPKGRPRGVELADIQWWVVTPDNAAQFTREFQKDTGDIVYIAISVPDYENLSLNMAELRRYIEQQKSIIVYYENSINKTEPDN
jgi:hypothetical protein